MIGKISKLIYPHRNTWIFWTIAAAGLLLRLEYLREFSREVYFDFAIGPDVQEYSERAIGITQGIFLPDEPDIHAPLYSFFLAFLYKITGTSIAAVRFIQIILGWGAYVVMAKLVRRISDSEKFSQIFLAAAMFTPVIFFHQGELISESLLAPLAAAALWMFYPGKEKSIWFLGAGCVTGLMILTHGLMCFFAIAEVFWLLYRKSFRQAGLFVAGIALLILPVLTVNCCRYGKFTPIQSNGAFNVWIGNNPDATGGCYLRPARWGKTLAAARLEAETKGVSESTLFAEKIFSFYRDDPAQIVIMPMKKAALLLSPGEPVAGADTEYFIRKTPVQKYLQGMMAAVLLLALIGSVYAVRKRELLYIHFYLLSGAVAAGLLLTVVSGRYRQGMMPGILLLAALGCIHAGRKAIVIPAACVIGGIIVTFISPVKMNAEAASIEAEAWYKLERWDKAKPLLTYAASIIDHPERFDNMLGAIAEKEKNYELAKYYYSRVIFAAPDDADGMLNYGHLLFYHFPEKRTEALCAIIAALQLNPAMPSAYDMLGQQLVREGKILKALEMFETALKYAPDNKLYQDKVNLCRKIAAQEKR